MRVAAALALGLCSSAALADGTVYAGNYGTSTATGYVAQYIAGMGNVGGGAFTFSLVSGFGSNVEHGNGSVFQTFCIETGEDFVPGGTYHASVSDHAIAGMNYWGESHQTLNDHTAYLYSNFRAGTLGGYDASSSAQAGLQAVIWMYQGQITTGQNSDWSQILQDVTPGTRGYFANLFYNEAQGSGWLGTGNVAILNIDDGHGNGQSQLILIPLPAETTMAGLGMLGMLGVRLAKRKRT